MSKARCNCGKFQLEVPAAQATAVCLCRCCTRGGGSVASYNAVIIKEDIKWIKGSFETTTRYEDKETDSGKVLYRHFCGTCGSPLLSVPAEGPISYFKISALEDQKAYTKDKAPDLVLFKKNALTWEKESFLDNLPSSTNVM